MARKQRNKIGFGSTSEKAVTSVGFFGRESGNTIDSWRRQIAPDRKALLDQYKGMVRVCADLNVKEVTKVCLKAYSKKRIGLKALWPSKSLNQFQLEKLCKSVIKRLQISDTDNVSELTSHPIITLLEHPNKDMDGFQLMELTSLFMELTGAAYWLVKKNALGVPVEIHFLYSQYVKLVRDDMNRPLYYVHGRGGEQQIYQLDEVIEFLIPHTDPGKDGLSPVAGIWESLNIDNMMSATEQSVLQNQGRPDFLVSMKDGGGTDEAIRMEQRFNQKFRQAGSGGAMFSEEDITVTPLSYTPKDMAAWTIHEKVEKRICLALCIPPALLEESSSQYNVDVTIRQRHIEWAIVPRLRKIQSILNHSLVPMFDDSGALFLAYDDPSITNQEMQLAENVQLVSAGVLDTDEVRVNFGYAPRGKDSPEATTDNVETDTASTDPTNSTSDTTESETVTAAGGTPDAPAPEVTAETVAQSELLGKVGGITGSISIFQALAAGDITKETAIRLFVLFFSISEAEATALVGNSGENKPEPKPVVVPPGKPPVPPVAEPTDIAPEDPKPKKGAKAYKKGHSKELPDGKELASVLKVFFAKQQKAVLGRLHKSASELTTKGIKAALPSSFIPIDEWTDELAEDSLPVIEILFREAYEAEQKQLVQRTGASPDVFNVTNPKLKKQIENAAYQFAKSTNETTSLELNTALKQLREEFVEGLLKGEPVDELADRVKSIFEGAEEYRAERIAQTEASRAHHDGLREAARDSGVVKGFELLLSSDACPECEEVYANNKQIDLDGSFKTNSDAPEAYQEVFVPIHPNCQCTVLEILDIDTDNLEE